jgi:hypothetical protein
MKRSLMAAVFSVVLFLSIIGCGSYYKVVDPGTGKTYYTDKVKTQKGGAIKLKDASTGAEVTIQNSEVTQISKKEFKANTQ